MALSDVFPYGAPELAEGAAERMARSTFAASLGVTILVAMLGAALGRGHLAAPSDIPETLVGVILPPPDVMLEPTLRREPYVPPAENRFDPRAIPELVPDAVAPEWDPSLLVTPHATTGESTGGIRPVPAVGEAAPSLARDPEPSQVVIVDEAPVLIRCAEARYPDLARAAGVEGTVRVWMLVGLRGRVERAIIAPMGSVPMLDEAALEAARTCVFTPALTNGHPVKVWVSQTYRFTLH